MNALKEEDTYDHYIEELLKYAVPYVGGFSLEHFVRLKKFGQKELTDNDNKYLDKMVTAIASNLIAHGVIIPTGHWQLDYHLTRKGRLIVEKGGWASYLDKEEKRLEKEAEKLDWDLKNSKWYHWSRWWPLGLSIVSLLLSGGKIYYDLQQDKHEEQSPTQSIQSQTGTHKTISPSDSIEDDQATSSQNEPNQPLPDSGNEWNLNELDIKAQHANKG